MEQLKYLHRVCPFLLLILSHRSSFVPLLNLPDVDSYGLSSVTYFRHLSDVLSSPTNLASTGDLIHLKGAYDCGVVVLLQIYNSVVLEQSWIVRWIERAAADPSRRTGTAATPLTRPSSVAVRRSTCHPGRKPRDCMGILLYRTRCIAVHRTAKYGFPPYQQQSNNPESSIFISQNVIRSKSWQCIGATNSVKVLAITRPPTDRAI